MKYIVLVLFSMTFQMSYGDTPPEENKETHCYVNHFAGIWTWDVIERRLNEEGCKKGDIIWLQVGFSPMFCDFQYTIVESGGLAACSYIGYGRKLIMVEKKKK
jgi:hypothetical protein